MPGYPVYYDPRADSNYFFYDGLYWVYQEDNWYASDWYNGPWQSVAPYDVPVFVLRVPVRYYRQPPAYFRGWRAEHPRDGVSTGAASGRRDAVDGTDGTTAPLRGRAAAGLPEEYSGKRYPRATERQQAEPRPRTTATSRVRP